MSSIPHILPLFGAYKRKLIRTRADLASQKKKGSQKATNKSQNKKKNSPKTKIN